MAAVAGRLALVVAAVIAVFVGEWRMREASVGVGLASRRSVSLRGVHPAFCTACEVRSSGELV